MIQCNLQGGIANVMFQLAAMTSLAKDNNTEACFPGFSRQLDLINADNFHNPGLKHAYEYATMFKNLNLNQSSIVPNNSISVPFGYSELQFVDGAEYTGFFQCERYFLHNRDLILDMFEPSDIINEYISNKYSELLMGETCGIHVRRGDYLKLQHVHAVQNIDYFNLGMAAIGKVDRYLVFSDDIQWCKDNFKGKEFVFIEGEKDYIDLFLLSKCTHQITSNSSFSWWGAWLNKSMDKKVVGPLRWFNEPSIDSKDILPESWTHIYA